MTGRIEPLRGASWNLKAARPAKSVRDDVIDFLNHHPQLDFLAVQEAQAYVAVLNTIPGWRCIYFDRDPSARDSGILVRDGEDIARPRLHRLSRRRWTRRKAGGGKHWPRSAVSLMVRGIRVASIHMPPAGMDAIERARRVSTRQCAKKLVKIGRRTAVPFVWPADWNDQPTSEGKFRPSWIADQLGASIDGDGIDYVLSRGCDVRDFKRLHAESAGSDHAPITFTVAEDQWA